MNSLQKTIVFGATSAIAEQAIRRLVQQGGSVYCIGRSEEKLSAMLEDLKVRGTESQVINGTTADLADLSTHADLIEKAKDCLGGFDSVLIAHGTLPDQKSCEESIDVALKEINVNALSVISLVTPLANELEQKGRGVIAVISSVAGDRGRQSNYVYGSAKGMVSIFLQGLRNRLSKKGVDVVTIKPGFVDTPMTDGMDKSGALWATSAQVGEGIVKAMQKGSDEAYLPGFWLLIMFIIRNIPEFIFKRLSL